MKCLCQLSVVCILFASHVACKKATQTSVIPASLNIINAVNGSNPLVTNFSPLNQKGIQSPFAAYYLNANQIAYTGSWESGSYAGQTYLSLSQISDTFKTIWTGSLNLEPSSIHSFFLSGDTTHIDTLFSTDLIPFYSQSDSVAGVRFVNLAQSSLPIRINLQGNLPSQSEFSGLGYRNISAFKSYPANSSEAGFYTFEIRDQATDSLLQTYTWNYVLSRNQTILICGSEGASASIYPITLVAIKNY